jgi:hypothetical protein
MLVASYWFPFLHSDRNTAPAMAAAGAGDPWRLTKISRLAGSAFGAFSSPNDMPTNARIPALRLAWPFSLQKPSISSVKVGGDLKPMKVTVEDFVVSLMRPGEVESWLKTQFYVIATANRSQGGGKSWARLTGICVS